MACAAGYESSGISAPASSPSDFISCCSEYPICSVSARDSRVSRVTRKASFQNAKRARSFASQALRSRHPLGQVAGQKLLIALRPVVGEVVQAAMQCDDDELSTQAPMLGILGSRHETQYSRLFRS